MIKREIQKNDIAQFFAQLPDRTNKGDMGRVLVACGSYDPCGLSMCGAAYFAAKAAYRTGAGIVEIFTHRENYAALAALVPEAVFSLYGYEESCENVVDRFASSLAKSDSLIIGCGLGKSTHSRALVSAAFELAKCPMVADADALNILAEDPNIYQLLSAEQRKRVIITPHPGEMARLCGLTALDVVSNTVKVAVNYSETNGVVCLLKDHNTVVTDGEIVYINQSGNAGMATAGSGDVLSGVIGALLARGERIFADSPDFALIAAIGAYIHGSAGDLASRKLGQYSLNASDLLSEIPVSIGNIFG